MPGFLAPRWRILAFAAGLAAAPPAAAQTRVTLAEAMQRATTMTPQARALDEAAAEAEQRVPQARAGYFPRVDFSETVERGNQPVFVFSSLLGQRRFAESNFAVSRLNEPDPVTNVRTAVRLQQSIFDGDSTRRAVTGARLALDAARASREASRQSLAFAAAQAFIRTLQVEASVRASEAAVTAAESDLERARARRDVGLATPADVLAVDVHAAQMRQRLIAARAELTVAQLELRHAIGLPDGEPFALAAPSAPPDTGDTAGLVSAALAARPDLRAADLAVRLAENAGRAARGSFLPRVGVLGALEFNGANVTDQRSSWVLGAEVQWNLFRGFADRARLKEAAHAERRAVAERDALRGRVAVDVRSAVARLESARARRVAGDAALAQARESQRITRDRYDSGLATVTDVLRAAQAVLDAESAAISAELDVVLHAVALDRALGRLSS